MTIREELPPLGEEIAAHVRDFCERRGMGPRRAQNEGAQIAELMLTLYAGQQIRFPADPFRGRYLEHRNAEIRRRFNGSNAPVLAVEYGLSRTQVWRIVTSEVSTT